MAAHNINITDGTTIYYLHGTSATRCMVLEYAMQTPDQDVQENSLRQMDGGEINQLTLRNITETINLFFYPGSKSQLIADIQLIEKLLQVASRRQQRATGPRLYLYADIDGGVSGYRSEIIAGRLELDDKALDTWSNVKIEARLHITRRFYWEGAQTELALTTFTEGPVTGGVTLYNDHRNWGTIAANAVLGSLPAPLIIELKNNTGSTKVYRNIYLCNHAFGNLGGSSHALEGESAVSGGSTASGAGNTAGSYRTITVNGTDEIQWALSSATMAQTAGRRFRILGRFTSLSAVATYITPQIRDRYGLITLATGDEVELPTSGDRIVDLGALPLPPGGYSNNWMETRLVLKIRTGASATVKIDYLQVFALDSYRRLYQRGYAVLNNSYIWDDGIEGLTALVESGPYEPIYTVTGAPLYAWPGISDVQRLHVLHDEGSTAPITNTFLLRAYYRPRRLTVG